MAKEMRSTGAWDFSIFLLFLTFLCFCEGGPWYSSRPSRNTDLLSSGDASDSSCATLRGCLCGGSERRRTLGLRLADE